MRRFAFMVGACAALFAAAPLLAAGRQNTPPPVRGSIPFAGASAETRRAVQECLGRMDTLADVTVNGDSIQFTVRPGQTACTSAVAECVEQSRGDDQDAHIELASMSLTGDVEVRVDGLSEEQTGAAARGLTRVPGVGRCEAAGAGRISIQVGTSRGVRVADLDEAIARACPRDGGELYRVTSVCWTAPAVDQQPGHS